MRVVICGGGVIGACAAWFLASRGCDVAVVERHRVAGAASGKSGGFLALDWCDGSPLAALARRSFALHAELAAAHPGRWGYRRLPTAAVSLGRQPAPATPGLPGWLAPETRFGGWLGTTETTAQIDPEAFTIGMLDLAGGHGATLVNGVVEGIERGGDGLRVTGVIVDGGVLLADAVVIAMGPWSIQAAAWLDLPAVHGLEGHSIVFDDPDAVAAALFVDCPTPDGGRGAPEVFTRPDGTTYVCGLPSRRPLPPDPAAVVADERFLEQLRAMIESFAPGLAAAPIRRGGACFRPVTDDGLPLIGAVAGLEGAFVATGHSVWGMLNAPATGEALAALMLDGASTEVDLRPFDPARLPPLDAQAT